MTEFMKLDIQRFADDVEKFGIEITSDTSGYEKNIDRAISATEKLEQITDRFKEKMENLFSNTDFKNPLGNINKIEIPDEVYQEVKNEYASVISDLSNMLQGLVNEYKDLQHHPLILESDKQEAERLKEEIQAVIKKLEELTGEKISIRGMPELTNDIQDVETKLTKISSSKVINNFSNNFGKKFVSTLDKSIKNVRKLVLSLFGVQTGWRAITRAMNAYKSIDKDITQKTQSAWIGLGAFMAPVLERMADLVIKLVAYLNKLVKYLTGVDFLARAISKSTSKIAGNVNKALASIDQITNLDTGGGLADDWTTPFKNLGDIDITPIKIFVDKAKELISTIFEPIQKAWENKGPALITSVKTTFDNIKSLGHHVFDSMLQVWTNGTGQKITETIISIWTHIVNIIGNMAKAFDEAWQHADTGTNIIQNISDIMSIIFDFVDQIADSLDKWTISPEYKKSVEKVLELIEKISKYLSDIGKWLSEAYKEYIKPLVDKLLPLMSNVITILTKVGGWVVLAFGKLWKAAWTKIEPIVKRVSDAVDYILTLLKDISDFVVDVLEGNWEKAWKDMKKVVKDMFDPLEKVKKYFNDLKGMSFGEKTMKVTATFSEKWDQAKTLKDLLSFNVGGMMAGAGKVLGSWLSSKFNSFDVGTNYVPNDQLAFVHKGEAIVPKEFNKSEFFNNANNEEVIKAIKDLEQTLIDKDMNAYISQNDVGKASVNYINNQNRLMGRSVV